MPRDTSAQIDMDDPLAPPGPKDIPPGPREPGYTSGEAPPPKRRGRPKGDAQLKLDLKEIEDKLATLLELPAVPMVAAGDVWPAQHIEQRAKPLARAISQACKDNPQLREKLLAFLRVSDNASLGLAIVTYIAPILLYYGILPVPPIVKLQFQIPDREDARQPSVAEQLHFQEAMYAREEQTREEALHSEDAAHNFGDPENSSQTPPPPHQAQARTPPAI